MHLIQEKGSGPDLDDLLSPFIEQAIEAAGVEFDGIMGAHFMAAVAPDAFFGIDLSGFFVGDGDDFHWAGIPAGATRHTPRLDGPGEHRECIPEDRIQKSKNAIMKSWDRGGELKIRNTEIRRICADQFQLIESDWS
jgi:hypothetical protein